MKKIIAGICIAIGMIGLTGCGGESSSGLTISYVKDDADIFLSYILEYKTDHPDVKINEQQYNSMEEMEAQLTTAISSGKCPDVILLDDTTALDVEKIASNGQFLDLTPYLQDYKEEEYFTKVLTSANTEDGQFVLPLGFSIPQIMTYKDSGIVSEEMTGIDFLNSLCQRMEEQNVSSDYVTIIPMYETKFSDWLSYMGTSLIEDGQVSADENLMKTLAEFYKAYLINCDNGTVLMQQYASDFAGAAEHMDAILSRDFLPLNIRYYNAMYTVGINKEFEIGYVPAVQGGICACITHFGMISEGAKEKEQAVDFLFGMLDTNTASLSEFNLPIRLERSILDSQIDHLKKSPGTANLKVGSNTVSIGTLQEKDAQKIYELCDAVETAALPNAGISSIIDECMADYFNNQTSFEDCLDQINRRLSIYVNE